MEMLTIRPSDVAGKNLSENWAKTVHEDCFIAAIASYLASKNDAWDWIRSRDFLNAFPTLDVGPYNPLLQAASPYRADLLAKQFMVWQQQGLILYEPGFAPKFKLTDELLMRYQHFVLVS